MPNLGCIIAPAALLAVACVGYLVFCKRCGQCGRFFALDSGHEAVVDLGWYEQDRDTADALADSLTTTLGSTVLPGSRRGGSYDIRTTVYVMAAEWRRCRRCGNVTVVAVPQRVRTYHDFPWDAGKRAGKLQAEGLLAARPPSWKVDDHLDRIRNRLRRLPS